jgi:hypothetical protein
VTPSPCDQAFAERSGGSSPHSHTYNQAFYFLSLGPKFWLSDNLVASDYTAVFSARLTKFGPGAERAVCRSPSRPGISSQALWSRSAAHERHGITNTGTGAQVPLSSKA